MIVAKIFCVIVTAALGLAAAIALGLGAVVCINYLETLFSKHSKS